MRVMILVLLCLSFTANAQVAPETVGQEKLAAPGPGWFLVQSWTAATLFDSETGEMQGTVTVSPLTPAIEPNFPRKEIYAAESFYSRGVRGERSDVLTIFDAENLRAIDEVALPPKTTPLWFRNYIGLLDDERHVAVFNMTPAQSISIVDVVDREFAGEISTPGCALILPVAKRSFIMICGDGSLQLIRLDENGIEAKRTRSKSFFAVEKDAVFDQVARTADGWLLLSHEGLVFHVTTKGDDIQLSKPWSILTDKDKEETWRPGGLQIMGYHRESGVLYVLMHKGGIDTHYEPGEEVWLIDMARQKRIGRMAFEVPTKSIQVTQESAPKLLALTNEANVEVYDGQLLRHLRTIKSAGASPQFLQTLGRHD